MQPLIDFDVRRHQSRVIAEYLRPRLDLSEDFFKRKTGKCSSVSLLMPMRIGFIQHPNSFPGRVWYQGICSCFLNDLAKLIIIFKKKI
jgi:hypothetical protein